MKDSQLDYIRLEMEKTSTAIAAAAASGQAIVAAAGLIAGAMSSGNKLLICGNGGSAADSQHMAAEFVGRFSKKFERGPLPALALTTDTSFLTAFCNDYSFEEIFARQVKAFGSRGDVLLGISTSGDSGNVVEAIIEAGNKGMDTIVLTGQGGRMKELADISIEIPSLETAIIQNVHLAVEHIICGLVERILFPEARQ